MASAYAAAQHQIVAIQVPAARFEGLVVGAEGGTDVLVLDVVADPHPPGNDAAIAGAAKCAATVRVQLVQGARGAIFAQIAGRRTNEQLHREQATGDQSFFRRVAEAKSDIDPIFDPVADAIIELNVGLHFGIEAAILVQHRADDGLQDGARPNDAQRPGEVFPGLPGAVQCLLEAGQGGLGGLEETLTFFGQRHAVGGPVKRSMRPQAVLFDFLR